jgi:hypothetical protein
MHCSATRAIKNPILIKSNSPWPRLLHEHYTDQQLLSSHLGSWRYVPCFFLTDLGMSPSRQAFDSLAIPTRLEPPRVSHLSQRPCHYPAKVARDYSVHRRRDALAQHFGEPMMLQAFRRAVDSSLFFRLTSNNGFDHHCVSQSDGSYPRSEFHSPVRYRHWTSRDAHLLMQKPCTCSALSLLRNPIMGRCNQAHRIC